jgi:hypothetical protein
MVKIYLKNQAFTTYKYEKKSEYRRMGKNRGKEKWNMHTSASVKKTTK